MIYFASDIHLGGGTPEQAKRTEKAFCRWLDSITADATDVYLLGDVFDFWFEYRRVVPQGFVRVLARLAALTDRGMRVTLFTGNHDMWCYDYLERECGIRIVRRPEVVELYGRKLHLAHGDNLNVKGQPMLRLMNATFRSTVARWLFSWLIHPDLALKFGCGWSRRSRKSHGGENITPSHLEYLVEYARNHYAEANDTYAYIFGHMHYAHRIDEGGFRVLFLSDWSGDVATYATMDTEANLQLKTFTI